MHNGSATIHLICGPTGAGKTHYAIQWAQAHGAIRFSIDVWMKTLYHPDFTGSPDLQWMLARIQRCETQIWDLAIALLATGTSVVLDLGLSKKNHRDKFRQLGQQAGFNVRLHYLTANLPIRRQRVINRNKQKPQTYSFEVTQHMFDFMESWFEPPQGEEFDSATIIHDQNI